MRKQTVTLLSRYVAAVHPEGTNRGAHLKKAKAYWRSLTHVERGRHRAKLEALIAKRSEIQKEDPALD